jgi:hypothetical protein
MQKNRLQELENGLELLAVQYPDVLNPKGFTSTATGKQRQVMLDIRQQYYAALREVIKLRKCVRSGSPAKKSLSDNAIKAVSAVTQDSERKSN